jgi:hypothetical protein
MREALAWQLLGQVGIPAVEAVKRDINEKVFAVRRTPSDGDSFVSILRSGGP